jgi:hypothetical protein
MYGEALSSTNELYSRNGIDLLARLIYAEARSNSERKKRGVAYVVENRREQNLSKFGGNTLEGVILKDAQFPQITSTYALCPDTTSVAWETSLDIAENLSSKVNPVGECLWYTSTAFYNRKTVIENGIEYLLDSDGAYKEVAEKVVIDNFTFYLLSE